MALKKKKPVRAKPSIKKKALAKRATCPARKYTVGRKSPQVKRNCIAYMPSAGAWAVMSGNVILKMYTTKKEADSFLRSL